MFENILLIYIYLKCMKSRFLLSENFYECNIYQYIFKVLFSSEFILSDRDLQYSWIRLLCQRRSVLKFNLLQAKIKLNNNVFQCTAAVNYACTFTLLRSLRILQCRINYTRAILTICERSAISIVGDRISWIESDAQTDIVRRYINSFDEIAEIMNVLIDSLAQIVEYDLAKFSFSLDTVINRFLKSPLTLLVALSMRHVINQTYWRLFLEISREGQGILCKVFSLHWHCTANRCATSLTKH